MPLYRYACVWGELAYWLCVIHQGLGRWHGGEKVVGEAGHVLVEQFADALGIVGGNDEADVVALRHPPDDFGIGVVGGIRVFLACQ